MLVYRTTTKLWEGPFKFISIDGETVVVQLARGRRIFRSTCVKPWIKSRLGMDERKSDDQRSKEEEEVNIADGEDEIDLGNKARKIKVKKGSMEERAFKESREK